METITNEDVTKEDNSYELLHGMSQVYREKLSALGHNRKERLRHTLVVMAIIQGPDKVMKELKSSMDSINIIWALLLATAILLLGTPASGLAVSDPANPGPPDAWRLLYAVLLTLAVICYFITITSNAFVTHAFNSAPRIADKFRVLYGLEQHFILNIGTFAVGHGALASALGIEVAFSFGSVTVGIISTILLLIGIIFLFMINVCILRPLGNVSYGPYLDEEPLFFQAALRQYKLRADKDTEKRWKKFSKESGSTLSYKWYAIFPSFLFFSASMDCKIGVTHFISWWRTIILSLITSSLNILI